MTAEPAGAESLLQVRVSGCVALVDVGSGARRNALTSPSWLGLAERMGELGADPTVRAIVIRGRGGTFCAGSDITEWVDADLADVEESFARMEAAFTAVEACPVPVIAEIRGVAAGAGCQLALACDLRYMADTARIGMPIARLGIQSSPAFAARMVELSGPAVARDLLYTGRLLDAVTAVELGLANGQFREQELADAVMRTVTDIVGQPTAAIRAAKQAVRTATAPMRAAARANPMQAVSEVDFRRGVKAFLA